VDIASCPEAGPLTRDLLRSPGYSLRVHVDHITLDAISDLVCMMVVSSSAALVFARVDRPERSAWMYRLATVLLIGVFIFFAIRLARRWGRLLQLRLGLDGEMATGEELNQLMLRGCHVFHDLPADGFNIDHVVVGPARVFAVETKARSKAPRGACGDGARLVYDGNVLHFPGWREQEPLEQARSRAKWLGCLIYQTTMAIPVRSYSRRSVTRAATPGSEHEPTMAACLNGTPARKA
jgi:Nuclease-related domain